MRRVSSCVLVTAVLATILIVVPARAQAAAPLRYVDPVFPAVDHTFDIEYSSVEGQSLRFDFYEPRGDLAPNRPLLLWFHGGTFIDGDKSTHRADAEWFARRGYAVASVNYRLNPDGSWRDLDIAEALADPEVALDFLVAAYAAFIDARAAIAFFRNHAAEYRIDTGRISTIGFSAGGVTALNTAFLGSYADGWNQWYDLSRVTGVAISYAGISVGSWAEAGEPSALMLHGRLDERIPHQDAEDYCALVDSKGADCTLQSFDGDHGITPDWNWEPVHQATLHYLYDRVIRTQPTGPATLRGRVLDVDFRAEVGATVTARRAGTTTTAATATTGGDGRWTLSLPAGSYDVSVSAPDHVTEYLDDLPAPDPARPIVLSAGQQASVGTLLAPTCSSPPGFPDVLPTGMSCGEIEWMVDERITTGYADGTFRPSAPITRQTLVAFLYRLQKSPPPAPDAPVFSDVPPGHPFDDAIAWAAGEGIITGFPDGTFRPTAVISRQTFAAILYRMWGEPPGPFPTPGAVVVPPSSPFFTELEWLWSTGYEAIAWRSAWAYLVAVGSYDPTAPVSRMSVASSFHRLVGDFYLLAP